MPHNTTASSLFGRLSARSSFMSPKEVKVTVQLLQDSDAVVNEFKRSLPAQAVLDYICELRGIRVKDYLGLRYQDQFKHRYWVDLSKPISHINKNFKNEALNLFLRFRYYPADPTHILEPCTRYQLFAQLQRDLIHGRLHCSQQKGAELGGLILQAQLGDYDPAKHPENYVSQYTLLLKQTSRTEEKIAEFHRSFAGMATEEAERTFLQRAGELDTYGFDPYSIKDPKDQSDVYIGVNHRGVLIFQANQKVHNIPWNQLSKVDYLGKELRLLPAEGYTSLANGENNNRRTLERDKKSRVVLKYLCPNGHYAKHLWNHILSQQAFFNEQSALMIKPKFSKPRIPLLSRGSTFRFPSKRVLREIEHDELQRSTLSDGAEGAKNTNTSMTTSLMSFSRYELPKHEPRQPSPWLSKSVEEKTAPASPNGDLPRPTEETDGIKTHKGTPVLLFDQTAVNSPVLCSPVSLPSTSFSAPEGLLPDSSPHTTTFTVHLIKFERSPACSPEPDDRPEKEEVVTSEIEEPLATSTPLFHKSEKIVNGRPNGTVNGNGSIPREKSEVQVTSRTVTNTLFTSFLVLLLLLALVIALFERQESQDFVDATPWLAHMRHTVYEPARHYVLYHYKKISGR